jgi:tetratricopeptide (TPR) repeat protein
LISLRKEIMGETHPLYYEAKTDLAMVLQQSGKWRRSLAIKREIRDVYRELYGSHHSLYAVALNNLAVTQMMTAIELDDAAENMKQAIAIWEETLGQEHPYLIFGHNNVAFIYQQQLTPEKAIAEYRVAIAVAESIGGHPAANNAQMNLGASLIYSGLIVEAEKHLRDLGEEFRYKFSLKTALGLSILDQQRIALADSILQDTLSKMDKVPWTSLAKALCGNAVARIQGGVGAEADTLLAKSKPFLIDGGDVSGGDWLAWRLYAIEKTIPMYQDLGQFEEAAEYQRAADRIRRRAAGEVDLDSVFGEGLGN